MNNPNLDTIIEWYRKELNISEEEQQALLTHLQETSKQSKLQKQQSDLVFDLMNKGVL
ncbi:MULTISPECIES: hypothetical protein [Pontibacillus]|uniref:Uncharacterized protein n=1 Tax=Pontibacillus chungwhensis TaxID=265426 RepID=A0ABY8UZS5_9BACI|nr:MULTISPECIES: hypothetical protein [Pontibacillus]MCD5324794.1 hypothetical protein [Pontibacillus sp. HN14]WIF98753.1 hypothetical protein QNI29_03620 [Pontibacillus chungwhensis]